MSRIYTDENCLISFLSSHSVCGVREEALKPCWVALWTVAKLQRPWQSLVLCVGAAYRFISRAAGPLALASTSHFLPAPFPPHAPPVQHPCVSPAPRSTCQPREPGSSWDALWRVCVWLESHVGALPPAHACCERRRHRGNCSAHQARTHVVSGS